MARYVERLLPALGAAREEVPLKLGRSQYVEGAFVLIAPLIEATNARI